MGERGTLDRRPLGQVRLLLRLLLMRYESTFLCFCESGLIYHCTQDLVHRWAVAMGEEFKGKGANVQLAPGIGIARVANAGRNFEYLCGEDPTLGAKLVGQVVKGIQSQG
jgi:hypothetical protein